jgi:hypothetical protein
MLSLLLWLLLLLAVVCSYPLADVGDSDEGYVAVTSSRGVDVPIAPHTSTIGLKSIYVPRSNSYLRTRQVKIREVQYDRSFVAGVVIGDQTFDLILDTGSSNTWVAGTGYSCDAPWHCYFGPTFDIDASFTPIEGQHLNTSYADTSYGSGPIGYADVTIAGVKVPQQEVGVVMMVR